MRTIKYTLSTAAVALMFTGCVKDTIYNTDHPEQGKVVTLVADWSDRGAEAQKPATYKIVSTGIDLTATSDKWALGKLFEPGSYTFRIHNAPDGITVSGNTAGVNSVTAPVAGTGRYVDPLPGWLLSGTATVTLEPDKDYDVTVRASQHIRRLTLVVEPEGAAAEAITAIEASLSGIATEWDMDAAAPKGEAASVSLSFSKQPSGEYAGKWTAMVRLLGVTGGVQRFTGKVSATGMAEKADLDSDLTASLSGFNDDKRTPLTLSSGITVEEDPVEPGFTATIKDWIPAGGGSGIAN